MKKYKILIIKDDDLSGRVFIDVEAESEEYVKTLAGAILESLNDPGTKVEVRETEEPNTLVYTLP